MGGKGPEEVGVGGAATGAFLLGHVANERPAGQSQRTKVSFHARTSNGYEKKEKVQIQLPR